MKELGRIERFKHLRPANDNSSTSSTVGRKGYARRSMDSRVKRSTASSDYGPKKKVTEIDTSIPRSSRLDKRKP